MYRAIGHRYILCHLCGDQLSPGWLRGYRVRALGETQFDEFRPRRLDRQLRQFECSSLPWALLGRDHWLAVWV